MTTTLSLFAPRPTEYAADLFDLLTDTTAPEDTMPATPDTTPAVADDAPVTPATHGHVTYVAQLADGTVATRSTKSMAYTHAVEVCKRTGEHVVWTWHKSQAAAVKAANQHTRGATVIPVVGHPYSSATAKSARAASK